MACPILLKHKHMQRGTTGEQESHTLLYFQTHLLVNTQKHTMHTHAHTHTFAYINEYSQANTYIHIDTFMHT